MNIIVSSKTNGDCFSICPKAKPYEDAPILNTSRPDIAFAVSKLCQFNSNPTATHLKAARRVLRYAFHTRNFSLKYHGDGSFKLKLDGFADADYGSNLIDRKSTTGYIFVFCGGPISWQSRKQPTVALSTMEAEYMALSDGIRELLSRMYFITELGISLIQPTITFTDNQAAIALADGEGDYRRAKHIDIRYHLFEIIYNVVRSRSTTFLQKSNRPTSLRRPFLSLNTTPASRLCNLVSEVFQCVYAGIAIIAAMPP
jgi:hypothetical protein